MYVPFTIKPIKPFLTDDFNSKVPKKLNHAVKIGMPNHSFKLFSAIFAFVVFFKCNSKAVKQPAIEILLNHF